MAGLLLVVVEVVLGVLFDVGGWNMGMEGDQ